MNLSDIAIRIVEDEMRQSTPLKSHFTFVFLCALALTSCSEQTTSRPVSGTLASEDQIFNFMNGTSWHTDTGVRFHTADGTTKSFQNFENSVQACVGTWRVKGSFLLTKYRCKRKEDGRITAGPTREARHEVRWAAHGFDLIDRGRGLSSEVFFSDAEKGFQREAEFKKIAHQVEL